ncbi:TonB-dependent receptor, partial [Stenotrophomonas acidaminiphila]|nr:TonB-dependent receptor [Stenotrophomonas acidaminiphila]
MKRQLLSAAICAAITAHSPLSFAQSDDSGDKKGVGTLDRITVTGSLIPQVQVETATPITSTSAQDIQKQGFKDVYEVLRTQPLATGAVQDSQFTGG